MNTQHLTLRPIMSLMPVMIPSAYYLLFLLALGFSGCGSSAPDTNQSAAAEPTQKSIDVKTLQEAQKILSHTTLQCRNMPQGRCASQVGMLLNVATRSDGEQGFQVAACTAFLIDSQHVMTNTHCVPDDLRYSGALCHKRIQLFFGSTQPLAHRMGDTEVIECQEVVKASTMPNTEEVTAPDYAILRLSKPTNRPFFKLNPSGLPDRMPLSLIRISPRFQRRSAQGIMSISHCETAYKTFFLPQLQRSDAPVMTLTGCEATHGNSGSPALDEQGDVRAILYMGLDLNAEARAQLAPLLLNRNLKQITGVTSVACMEGPFSVFQHPPMAGCKLDLTRTATEASRRRFVTRRDQRELAQQIQARFQSWSHRDSSTLQWHLALHIPRPGFFLYVPIPACINPSALSRNFQMPLYLPQWVGRFYLTENLQLGSSLLTGEKQNIHRFQFVAQGLERSRVRIQDPRGVLWFDTILRSCSAARTQPQPQPRSEPLIAETDMEDLSDTDQILELPYNETINGQVQLI